MIQTLFLNIPQLQISKKNLSRFLILLGVFIFCYVELFTILIKVWWNNSSQSHGFLIPFIDLYLIYLQRDKLKYIYASPTYLLGLPVFVGGVLMYLAGHAGAILLLQELSFVITVIGLVLLLLGVKFLKALLLPVVYLSFMLTIWSDLLEGMHLPFQKLSALIGTELLQWVGIPAYRTSIYIELPNITLEVAKVCSGINYLMSIAAIGVPLAYITLRGWPRRLILVSGAIMIAILANSFRVAWIGVLAYYKITDNLHGPYQVLQAMFVSVVGFIALFIGAWILSKTTKRSDNTSKVNTPSKNLKLQSQSPYPNYKMTYSLILTGGILILAGSYINFYSPSPVPLQMALKLFPYEIEGWSGFDSRLDDDILKNLPVDHDLERTYRSKDGKEINLYVGYFESQRQGKEVINEQTSKLHYGASTVEIKLDTHEEIKVNKIVRRERNRDRLILFWYNFNGRITANRYMAKAYTILDALTRNRTNGAIIIVDGTMDKSADQNELIKDEEDFINHLIPVLHRYLP